MNFDKLFAMINILDKDDEGDRKRAPNNPEKLSTKEFKHLDF